MHIVFGGQFTLVDLIVSMENIARTANLYFHERVDAVDCNEIKMHQVRAWIEI